MNIKPELQQLCEDTQNLRLNDVNIESETIQAIMINEVVPLSGGGFLWETGFRVYVNDNSDVQKNRNRDRFSTGYSE